jgi:hypothetical protein
LRSAQIQHLVLERRAIENYLTDPAVGRVMGAGVSALSASEKPPSGWKKKLNWRVAREMPFKDIADNDLGKFLQKLKDDPTKA